MINISIFENREIGVKDQVCIYWVIYWLKILWDGCNFLFNLNNYKINDLLQDELNESEYYDLFQYYIMALKKSEYYEYKYSIEWLYKNNLGKERKAKNELMNEL